MIDKVRVSWRKRGKNEEEGLGREEKREREHARERGREGQRGRMRVRERQRTRNRERGEAWTVLIFLPRKLHKQSVIMREPSAGPGAGEPPELRQPIIRHCPTGWIRK